MAPPKPPPEEKRLASPTRKLIQNIQHQSECITFLLAKSYKDSQIKVSQPKTIHSSQLVNIYRQSYVERLTGLNTYSHHSCIDSNDPNSKDAYENLPGLVELNRSWSVFGRCIGLVNSFMIISMKQQIPQKAKADTMLTTSGNIPLINYVSTHHPSYDPSSKDSLFI